MAMVSGVYCMYPVACTYTAFLSASAWPGSLLSRSLSPEKDADGLSSLLQTLSHCAQHPLGNQL